MSNNKLTQSYRFDDRVAVVTGAGAGLGRQHALLLAQRGARVVVNDLGASISGEGRCKTVADKVVEEIKSAGGEAFANYDSVEQGDRIVQTALNCFGRIDIVVNNAGFLRDSSFAKMTDVDWDMIYRVHILGAFKVTRAAWPHMQEQRYGRIVNTVSAALYGNFGQVNYSTAKSGLVGFTRSLALEGQNYNILTNAIAPLATSRMMATIATEEMCAFLKPELISPLVVKLCAEQSSETGSLFEVGAGWIARVRWERSPGAFFGTETPLTPEKIDTQWDQINDFTGAQHPKNAADSFFCALAFGMGSGGGSKEQPQEPGGRE